MTRRPPRSPLFPSTPLFRSCAGGHLRHRHGLLFRGAQRSGDRRHERLVPPVGSGQERGALRQGRALVHGPLQDRKSTRLNSSHSQISYAVFCLKKKKKNQNRSLFLGCADATCLACRLSLSASCRIIARGRSKSALTSISTARSALYVAGTRAG